MFRRLDCEMKFALTRAAALLIVIVAGGARATPTATLNLSAFSESTNRPVDASGVPNGTHVTLTVQYEISGLDRPARVEVDLCNIEISWDIVLPSGGAIFNYQDPLQRCPPPQSFEYYPSQLAASDTIAVPANSTQSVSGIFQVRFEPEWALIPDGYVWDIPVRLALQGAPPEDLLTEHYSLELRSQPHPDLQMSVTDLTLADGPDGHTPGVILSYQIFPWNNEQVQGAYFMPGTSVFTDPIPPGAIFISAVMNQDNDANSAAWVAGQINTKRVLDYSTGSQGEVTAVTYRLDNVLGSPWNPTENGVVVRIWYPLVQGGQTVMDNHLDGVWGNGFAETRNTHNVLGTVAMNVSIVHSYASGGDMTANAAHNPLYGDWLTAYDAPGALIRFGASLNSADDGTGAAAGGIIKPTLFFKLPAHMSLRTVEDVQEWRAASYLAQSTLAISTDPFCGPSSTDWVPAPWDVPAALAQARCFKIVVNALTRKLDVFWTGELDEPYRKQLLDSPGAFEFEDTALTVTALNVSQGNSNVGFQPGNSITATDRATMWNVQSGQGGVTTSGSYRIGQSLLAQAEVPWSNEVNSVNGFTELTFAETLPLEFDLDGPPIPHPAAEGYGLPLDDFGNTLLPTCTWNAQDRSQIPAVPAAFRCTFADHYPAIVRNPATVSVCENQPGWAHDLCFSRPYTRDTDNLSIFNPYYFQIPLRVVAGTQGQATLAMKVWSTNDASTVASALPGTSEDHPYLATYGVTLAGKMEMVLQKTAPATTVSEGGSLTYTIAFSNTGNVGTQNTRLFDLLGRDSLTGMPLDGCQVPRFVSAQTISSGLPALIEYTVDSAPTPTGASWMAAVPNDRSTVTGLRISPRSAFNATPGFYSPGDAPLEVQVTLADRAGVGTTMCNTAGLSADGFTPTISTAARAQVVRSCVDHVYGPGYGEFGLLLFEDLWPSKGDLDFNDESIAYNQDLVLDQAGRVTELMVSFQVQSVGATLHNGAYLHLPLPANTQATFVRTDADGSVRSLTPLLHESELVLELTPDTRSLFPAGSGFINTEPSQPVRASKAFNVHITFAHPVAIDTSSIPDVFIARSHDFGHQIHLPQYAGTDQMNRSLFLTADDGSGGAVHFVDKRGLPFALSIPASVHWPIERVAIDSAYPDIVAFATSAGTDNKNWYETHVNAAATYTHGAQGALPPLPVLVGPEITGACPP